MPPDAGDFDTHFIGEMGPVRDQGQRPTCLAFAATCAHELARHESRGHLEELSEESLFWSATQDGKTSAAGARTVDVAEALLDPGQAIAAVAPYDGSRAFDPAGYQLPAEALDSVNLRRANMRQIAMDAGEIEQAIENRQVVITGLNLWPEFFQPVAGVIADPLPGSLTSGRHAVALVGFSRAKQTFLVRNSWGSTWGNNGYAVMSYAATSQALDEAWVTEDSVDGHP